MFFRELGVEGVSQDRAWITRPVDVVRAAEAVGQIREQLGDCTRCKLHSTRSNIVYGVGDPCAELMFVGEAPGPARPTRCAVRWSSGSAPDKDY